MKLDKNRKKLIQLRMKLEFYKKLDKKLEQVLNAELGIEDWSGEVYLKISRLENELDDLKMEINLPDEEWDEDEVS
jgi:archaellum component FlaC